jgi:hypothetical protein
VAVLRCSEPIERVEEAMAAVFEVPLVERERAGSASLATLIER